MRKLGLLLAPPTVILASIIFSQLGQAANQPVGLGLPWPNGESWYYTGGPHESYSGTPWDAVDFQPPDIPQTCTVSSHPAVAAAAGRVTVASNNTVEIDHGSSLTTGYFHLANIAVSADQQVSAGTPLGYPSCQGGSATGSHLHFYTKYNGARQAIDGLVLDGWTIHQGSSQYSGCMTSGSSTVCPGGRLTSHTAPPTPTPAAMLGVLGTDGGVVVKQGGLTADWVFERGETQSIAIDGDRIVTLGINGDIVARDGIFGEWVRLAGGARSIAAGGGRVAFVANDGGVEVKDGTYGEWTFVIGDAKQVALSGNRIAVLLNDSHVFAKDGIFGEWVDETGEAQAVALDGNRIGVIKDDGGLTAKEGLSGEWVYLNGDVKSVAMGGDHIAVLHPDHTLQLKDGMFGEWTFQSGQVCGVALAGSWLVTLREDQGVVAKDLGVGDWIFERGEAQQIAATNGGSSGVSDQPDACSTLPPTPIATPTSQPGATDTPTFTPIPPNGTQTPTPVGGATSVPTPTPVGGATSTPTPVGGATSTATPTSTHTPTPPGVATAVRTPTPVTATPPPANGDANGDGSANAVDAALALQYAAGLLPSIGPNADVNGDGVVNALDAAIILQYVAGLIPGLRA